MDDLTQQLQKVLSDPQTMGQLQGLLNSLGGQEEKPAPAPEEDVPGPEAPQE